VDDKFENFAELKNILSKKFQVTYNDNVSLYTIRHFTQTSADAVAKGKEVLVRQVSRETMQIVTKEA
jgi:aspartate kinase